VIEAVRRVLRYELGIYRSLARWVARRPAVGRDDQAVGYAQAVTPVMWLWIFASAVEVPLFHLLLPWDLARTAFVVVGVWGFVWMVGLLASYHVHPHLLTENALRVRNGPLIDVCVPWSKMQDVKVDRRDLESSVRSLQPRVTERGTDLCVGVSGQVNVRVTLREAVAVRTPKEAMEVTAVSFFVDDPRDAVRRLRDRLATTVVE
jgi:hypothetical protein